MKTIPGLFFLLFSLAKERRARSHRLLARLLRDEEGSWLLSMTLILPVLIGVAGLGTEGGLLFYQHRSLQSAADAAAYSAALSYSFDNNTTNMQNQAKAVVAAYGYTLGTGTNQANVTATATTFASLTAVQVSISRPQTAIFSSIYLSTLQNSASATAVLNGNSPGGAGPSGGCMLALGNTATGNNEANAIKLQGNPTINASNCGIFSDSTDCVAGSFSESLGGNATINAGSFGSAGCHNIFGSAEVNLPGGFTCNSSDASACTQHDGAISNPYMGITLPSTPAPPCAAASPSGGVLGPGRYCGLNVNGTNVTLSGGVYILDCNNSTCPSVGSTTSMLVVKNASLTVASGASATLVFTCSTCPGVAWPSKGLLLTANGSISLNAPTTGATAGFVIMADPNMPLNTVFDTHSNPNACFLGTVYAPTAEFDYGGTPTTGCGSSTSFCFQLITNTIDLYGNASLNGAGCSLSGGGTGPPIQKPIGSTVTLVD